MEEIQAVQLSPSVDKKRVDGLTEEEWKKNWREGEEARAKAFFDTFVGVEGGLAGLRDEFEGKGVPLRVDYAKQAEEPDFSWDPQVRFGGDRIMLYINDGRFGRGVLKQALRAPVGSKKEEGSFVVFYPHMGWGPMKEGQTLEAGESSIEVFDKGFNKDIKVRVGKVTPLVFNGEQLRSLRELLDVTDFRDDIV